MKYVLASKSPRRSELLKFILDDFIVCPSNFDEQSVKIKEPKQLVETLSFKKADFVKDKFTNDLIIGCDTIVFNKGKILGIPKNESGAFEMLKSLSNKRHKVISGVTIIYKQKIKTFSVETNVEFYEIPDNEILDYIKTNEPFDKAGGYAIQNKGSLFVKQIKGDYFNVVGLPISKVKREIDKILIKN